MQLNPMAQSELDALRPLRSVDRTTPGAAHAAAFQALDAVPKLLDEIDQLRGFLHYLASFSDPSFRAAPSETP